MNIMLSLLINIMLTNKNICFILKEIKAMKRKVILFKTHREFLSAERE